MPVRRRRVPPRRLDRAATAEDARTIWFGLAYASATTADAPAFTNPAAKLSTRCLAIDERALREPRLPVARRVAQVVQQDDGIRGELDAGGDLRLPEVLMRVVAAAGRGLSPKPFWVGG